MAEKKIVLTGGGTAGHVTPNIALLPSLREAGYEIQYIGSLSGIEKKLMEDRGIPYFGIETGKLRRYFDPKNFSDPFRVIRGYNEARKFLKEYKPDVLFSKGGYVSVPVVRAAASLHIPCIIHESDMTPGLANKICIPAAKKVCCNFPETLEKLPPDKAVLTGTPIRDELLHGSRSKGLEICGFDGAKPVLLVIGGSLGASSVNQTIRDNLDALLAHFDIIHICGKDKVDNLKLTIPGYKQFEFVKEELCHLFAAADIVVSRAGANAICELLALHKPAILVPLPAASSRGDQILNAASFEKQGYSMVVQDDEFPDKILDAVKELYENREKYTEAMKQSSQINAIPIIMDLINRAAEGKLQ
ncbi:MAG: undecaprenyldiphospho-muramoylpentapeptide beta-N-acetylglucosaminyltransferase [Lachnospiraceae bacterium]|jgi:UDP-N-acetylglucosamine--N-acetylmuramyl-(pentapeptide) pyrophosphoryl-undecaprenol N-acetylglucosamine transferase|nr:undecaprenyldiphospho-muramoylpentapeptide beta-N-acetylglucosaminyltransferase [Lachnospiraceae bacterium]MCH4029159.1 undecaprenyldiphospho-muramoylpentapeptide beta-N-acetylglucosaminyltransferase [Lachnospiraceae bacterium]MCH4067015.1 undecaprenyldiphospho-muramoylpentapeptide beta-N-acetylglucosaminyltransferase [Lachnospiraceae bacterium]MCH4113040.1 undecaprenyldiphospho-muramoylpentapeptide beta-N-acetylglucosaminyltransferase [Lachnospiraceae bacterium]MCI1352419.1 undecaprenyldiph